ncbi:hypothetical protein BDF20DRAFT_822229, partial [Mycotypha africana]|uniref:uncharacterized protein n=1 Tax=Mycotypha africana TaxID=64632 RepID=UPI0022FFD03D
EQLWMFEDGYLVNRKTSLVIDIEGGDLRCDQKVIQYDRKKTMAHNQRWQIRDGFIYAVADPRLVLTLKNEDGSRCFVSYRNLEDSELQQWYIEPYGG